HVSAHLQRQQERRTLLARVAEKQGEIATLTSGLEVARSQSKVQSELLGIQERLRQYGLGALKNWLEAKYLPPRSQAELSDLEGKNATAKEALSEAESNVREADAKAQQKLSEERVKASNDLAETGQQLVKLADRFERLVIRAPSDGIIQELVPKSPGEVLRGGDLVARIVPTGRELVAEVRIDPKDSGHIAPGADADVRLVTYDS